MTSGAAGFSYCSGLYRVCVDRMRPKVLTIRFTEVKSVTGILASITRAANRAG